MSGRISKERKAFLAADFRRGFIAYCGFQVAAVDWGSFQSRLELGEAHRQQDGFVHAGVMATMADHTAGYAAFTTVPEDHQILTVEFKINFLRPAHGNSLVCRARVIREGTRIIVAESEVTDVRGVQEVPVAKALVTLAAVSRERLHSEG